MKTKLFIFTHTYPFGDTDAPFLTRELISLEKYFSEIYLIPSSADLCQPVITQKYFIDTSLSTSFVNGKFTKPIINFSIIQDAIKVILQRRIDRFRKLIWTVKTASRVANWAMNNSMFDSTSILYSYWFSSIAVGLAIAKSKSIRIPFVARAHGGDLYENRTFSNFFPLRSFALNYINRLYLISQDGYNYMNNKYPEYKEKYRLQKLGVELPKEIHEGNVQEKVIQLVSCAAIRPVKRIDLLCDAIHHFGAVHDGWKIHWNHFGGGDIAAENLLREKIKELPINVQCTLWGQVPNEKVIDYYRKNKVDFFVSVSENEGIPVSMMEAMSFGIPVVATEVGGVPEIVTNENGYLLPANPTIEEISNAIWTAVLEKDRNKAKREMCRRMIAEQYKAELNYPRFAEEIQSISEP